MADFAEAASGMICEEFDAAFWIVAELNSPVDLSHPMLQAAPDCDGIISSESDRLSSADRAQPGIDSGAEIFASIQISFEH